MIAQIIGKSQTHSLKLFAKDEINWLEGRIFKRQTKRGEEFAVKCFVPLQDFTSSSDIDWSRSASEIDAQLYAKYGLTKSEQKFIESMIKLME